MKSLINRWLVGLATLALYSAAAAADMGRFPVNHLSGGAKIEGGRLILGANGAAMIAAAKPGTMVAPPPEAGVAVAKPAPPVPSLPPVADETIRAARLLRERFLADPWRPGFHFCTPEDKAEPGDPNGAFYHNGRYHLMYLYNRNEDNMCPSFLPLPSSPDGGKPSGKHLLLFISHTKGCQYYDAKTKELVFDATRSGADGWKVVERAPLELKPGEPLKLRVFVDKPVVEVFANDRQAICRRVYPAHSDSLGVVLCAEGGKAKFNSTKAWEMMPSNSW